MPALVARRLPRRRCVEVRAIYPIGNLPLHIFLAPANSGYYLVRRRYLAASWLIAAIPAGRFYCTNGI